MSFRSDEGGGLRWKTAAIAAIVLVLIAVGLTVALVGRGEDSPPSAEPASPPPSSTPSPPAEGEAYESSCGLTGGSTQAPTSEPGDIEWTRLDTGWAYPISASAGPGERPPDGPWSCYARTPMGAIIAAYTINNRLLFVDDFDAAVEQQIVPSVGRDALIASGQPVPASVTDTKGFILESYTPDDAVVSFYLVSQGTNYTCSAEVTWRDGDWALRALRDGSTSSGCVEAAPPRYVPWGDD